MSTILSQEDRTKELQKLLGSDFSWSDEAGNQFILNEMTTRHLRNAVKCLQKSLNNYGDFDHFDAVDCRNKIRKLQAELYRRHCAGEDIL